MNPISVIHPSPPAAKPKSVSKRKASRIEAAASPSQSAPDAPPTAPPVPISHPPAPSTYLPSNTEVLVQDEALLFLWDATKAEFIEQGVVMAVIVRRTNELFNYALVAHDGTRMLLAHHVSSDMNPRWAHRMSTFTWNTYGSDRTGSSWCLQFASEAEYAEMSEALKRCIYETLHQTPWGKLKEDEQRYVMSSTEDVVMKDVQDEDEEDEEDEVLDELEVDKGQSLITLLVNSILMFFGRIGRGRRRGARG